jgi:competence protein ComEC
MINAPDGTLRVFMISVGQGDSTIIVSPEGAVIVIDAMRPRKLKSLLADLGNNDDIEHLIITHPHSDHFSAGNRLAEDFNILDATLAPYWHEFGLGPPTYRKLVGRLDDQDTSCTFLSGYSRWFPDGAMTIPSGASDPEIDPNKPYLELLGPTNGMVSELEDFNTFNTNHLSIMTRLCWRNFKLISAGDAQMENWQFFDRERLMKEKCQVLRTAHHGSSNGTQWERINRLDPEELIVSSDPASGHHLPDLMSSAIFAKYNTTQNKMAVITRDTGTIELTVQANGTRSYRQFGDTPTDEITLASGTTLDRSNNPTDWLALLNLRMGTI